MRKLISGAARDEPPGRVGALSLEADVRAGRKGLRQLHRVTVFQIRHGRVQAPRLPAIPMGDLLRGAGEVVVVDEVRGEPECVIGGDPRLPIAVELGIERFADQHRAIADLEPLAGCASRIEWIWGRR